MKKFLIGSMSVLVLILSSCSAPEIEQAVEESNEQVSEIEVGASRLYPGVYSLGPAEQGWEELELAEGEACPDGELPRSSNEGIAICKSGEFYESLDSTWANPDIAGVYLRIPWNSIHLSSGTEAENFDFSTLDHELEQAVKHGKYLSLSFGAGNDGLPEWLFTEGGVEAYNFQDGGSNLEAGKCGTRMTLGDPTDEEYQKHYFDLIHAVGEHIQEKQEWFDAVAYFKISGANLYTHEFRLPNTCDPACEICNTEVWAEAGYTPEGIYDFVMNQMDAIQEALPGKPMVYQLIQDGLPWTNDNGDYMMADGSSSGEPIVRSADQVDEIIRRGSEAYGPLFVVSHNGLGGGKPNNWVVKAGKSGQPTGFQTKNVSEIDSPAGLQMALENLLENSTAHYLEAYEQILWEIGQNDNELVPNSDAEINTLEEWNEELQKRI